MSDFMKKDIISLPQRNRRRISARYSSDEDYSDDANESNNEGSDDMEKDREKLYGITLEKIYKYEYLDHTADIILHSYGNNLMECFESICISMFNYMCNLNKVELKIRKKVIVHGDNLDDLLFKFLNEFHFLYGSEYFICKRIDILTFDTKTFFIKAVGYGETFSSFKHEGGTEIKAITKHELKIISNEEGECEIFVLVDI
ncbi:protein archease [Plasmodium brasilianum]|uniref:Protein archease-like n=2 Tax=Plasmodium (Plasmodium) TaxID=418103 RepID=A0A1A8W9K5_PLAMA|nr:protein archease, putative [Plasmodium malariae]KAI4835732.1 protein archease [Plasmodium brasilianum]SBS89512.1 protein archease, putative [Plasmodium malariae]SCP02664.1 protein archease, putative [Plasmodium malariae]